ncbi:MAG: ArnT family glycosyltransferase, partial [Bacteroidales bacterium]
MRSEARPHPLWFILVSGVFLLALGVRLLGLAYGLPAVFNPDETPILNRALAFAKGDPNPHNFLYPSLYFYALFAWETLFFLVGRLFGVFASLAAFQREFFTDPSRLFLAGRAFTALCGTLIAVALYVFGKRLYGRAAGLAAALFYAVAPIAVRDAHYVKLDVPVTLFVVLAHGALARIVTNEEAAARRRSWIVAGLLGGLAISTHYYVGLIVFSFAAVAIADLRRSGRWQESMALLAWSAVGVIAGFFAGTPFMLVEPHIALRDIVAVREIDIDRAVVGGGAFVAAKAYFDMLLRDAIGWPVFLASLAGFAWAVLSDWRRGLLLLTFPLLFFAFCANTVPMTRYLNAMLPSVALAAAFLLVSMSRRLLAERTVLTVLVVLAAIPGFLGTLRTDLFLRQADTRTIARQFIESHVPAGSSLLVQPYSVPLRQSREALVEALTANLGSPERAS